jgi:hypothetical protein
VEDLTEPEDLTAALDATPAARQNWGAFPRSTRRAILEWIGNAKTNATRQARIERTARDAAINIRANQWRQPKGSGHSTKAPLRCAERGQTAGAMLSAGRCQVRRML